MRTVLSVSRMGARMKLGRLPGLLNHPAGPNATSISSQEVQKHLAVESTVGTRTS